MTRTITLAAVTAALALTACGGNEPERTGPPTSMTTNEITALAQTYLDECVADGGTRATCKDEATARAVLESEGLAD